MRYTLAGVTCLCVLLTPFAAAFPSPVHDEISSWRRLTDPIIARVWGLESSEKCNKKGKSATKSLDKSIPASLSARYGKDIVLRFNISNAEEAQAIAEASDDLYLDVWEFNDNWVDIRLAKDVLPSFLGLLPSSLQNAHAPLMPESALAEVVSHALPDIGQLSFSHSLRPTSKDLFFTNYQPLSVIEPWMRLLASMFTTHVQLVTIGQSEEGRDILALRLGVHPTDDVHPSGPRKTIVVSAGLHAREWISVSSVTYVAYQLITSYGKSQRVTKLLERFDFVFIPTLNPDGYAYTWDTDRLWRKNRQPTPLRFCHGVDLDRAFGFEWDGDARPENPCSESYPGTEPWVATEAKAFADWARNETDANDVQFVALLDLHSYSQQVLYPYSFSCDAAPPTLEDLEELAMGLAKAMKITSKGHSYRANSACEGNVNLLSKGRAGSKKEGQILPRIQLGGGSLLDWAYHELKISYAFQIKLRDMGSYGFLLPKEHIVPQGKELLGAINYLGKFLSGEIGLSAETEESRATDVNSQVAEGDDELMGAEVEPGSKQNSPDLHEADDLMLEVDTQWELRRRRAR